MYSLYGAIPGMPTFPGMMQGMPQPVGPPGMGTPNMPMANAAPPQVQAPAQRGGMSIPMAPPPAMQGQQQQDPMQQAAMMMAMQGRNGQQGVPGSQLSNILGISGSDVRSFLGLGNTKDKLPYPGMVMPEMAKSSGPFGMGSLSTGDMKSPMGVPEMPGMANMSTSLGAMADPTMQMPGQGIPPLDPGIGAPAMMPPPQIPWWQAIGTPFGF